MIVFTGHKGRKLKAGSSKVTGLGRRPDYEQQASDFQRKHQVKQTIIEVISNAN